MLRVAVGTHWSEDTLGLPRKNPARCVLTSRSSKGVCCVNFPLFTYSVFGEKNVSQEVRNISRSCRRSRVVHRRGQTPCVQLHCSSRCLSLRSAHVRASSSLGRHGKPKALKD